MTLGIPAHAPRLVRPRDRVRVRAFTFEPRDPPKEIQLWNAGDNATDYGVHKWTARSVATVIDRYESRGNPLLIDVEHNGATNDVDEPSVTGGYARLELRAGAPWLVFEWSAYAVEQIRTGQRRFLSPEYDVDRTTGEILALYRVSLVADPGTHRARMLASANPQEMTTMDPKLAAIMAILSSVSDPQAAIDAIKSLVANLDGGEAPAVEPPADGEMAADAGGGTDDSTAPGDKDKVAAAAPAPATPGAGASAGAGATVGGSPAPAGGTTPRPAPLAAVLTDVGEVEAVGVAATAAVAQIHSAQRDHLLATQGDRLDPSIRRWASSQPLAVVQGLINAAPAKQEPPGRVSATRGATQGNVAAVAGLQGEALEELHRSLGIVQASATEPHTTQAGVLVLPTVAPSVHRERKRAAAAAAAAGKAGT